MAYTLALLEHGDFVLDVCVLLACIAMSRKSKTRMSQKSSLNMYKTISTIQQTILHVDHLDGCKLTTLDDTCLSQCEGLVGA